MTTTIRINMPNGAVFELDAQVIAHERAKWYAQNDNNATEGPEYDKTYAEELEYTLGDNMELLDWLYNNTNWEDIEDQVKQTEIPKPDYKAMFCNSIARVVRS